MRTFFAFLSVSLLANSQSALAPGDPPLTQEMVTRRIAVIESFLTVKFTNEQRSRFQVALIADWKNNNKETIEATISDQKYFNNEQELRALGVAAQARYVADLRDKSTEATAAILLEVYNAAYPDVQAKHDRALTALSGEWRLAGAMTADTNPLTHAVVGAAFSNSLVLDVYPDGRFKHLWAHMHCRRGNTCCQQYGSQEEGSVSVEGQMLVFIVKKGNSFFQDPCGTQPRSFTPINPHVEALAATWLQPPGKAAELCLATMPFQVTNENKSARICYPRAAQRTLPPP